MKTILESLRIHLVLTVLTGFAYPLVVTAIARIAFRDAGKRSGRFQTARAKNRKPEILLAVPERR